MDAIGTTPGATALIDGNVYTGHSTGVMASASTQRIGSQPHSRPSAESYRPKDLRSDCEGSYARASHDRAMHPLCPSLLPPGEPESSAPNDYSSAGFSNIPEWHRDLIDLEAACMPWHESKGYRFVGQPKASLFRSKVELKARNPADCQVIGYDVRVQNKLLGFIWRILGFLVFCFVIVALHHRFEISCTGSLSSANGPTSHEGSALGRSLLLIWSETLVTTGACFLIAQGYFGYVRGFSRKVPT